MKTIFLSLIKQEVFLKKTNHFSVILSRMFFLFCFFFFSSGKILQVSKGKRWCICHVYHISINNHMQSFFFVKHACTDTHTIKTFVS